MAYVNVYDNGGGIRKVAVIDNVRNIIGTTTDGGQTGANLAAELAVIGAPVTHRFSGFSSGRLLASLVASSAATRADLLVTVYAPSHGIPATLYDGYEVFFPGCASLAAGWYPSLTRTSANYLTFALPTGTPGADFTGESINGGAFYSAQTRVASLSLPAGTLQNGSRVCLRAYSEASTVSSTSQVYFMIGEDQVGRWSAASLPNRASDMTAIVDGGKLRAAQSSTDADGSGSLVVLGQSFSSPVVCNLDARVFNTANYVFVSMASFVEVNK